MKSETCHVKAGLGLLFERVRKGAAIERVERRAKEKTEVSCMVVVVYMYRYLYRERRTIIYEKRGNIRN